MITLKQIGVFIALGVVLVLLLMLGLKSRKIKELATRLLRTSANLKTQKYRLEIDALKKKERGLVAKRKEKTSAYRDYVKSLKPSGKS